MSTPPINPKIYHIIHIDNLASLVRSGLLFSYSQMKKKNYSIESIGYNHIKERRLTYELSSIPGLFVGECVPFYFCPRAIMLYIFNKNNSPDLTYHGGQEPIIHLEADLNATITWANKNNKRWAFTTTTAAERLFNDYSNIQNLNQIDWESVNALQWDNSKTTRYKQAEFLLEEEFPWGMFNKIGVYNDEIYKIVDNTLTKNSHRPILEIRKDWYY